MSLSQSRRLVFQSRHIPFSIWNSRKRKLEKSVTCEDKTSQPVTLFVQNLSLLTQPHHLVQFFGDACRVVDYHFIYDEKTGRFLRQCYVQFETREIGVQALKLNGNHLLGRPVELQFSSKKIKELKRKTVPSGVVAVTNFGCADIQIENFLKNLFSPCGNIRKVKFISSNHPCRGLAFVHFFDAGAAEKALRVGWAKYGKCELRVVPTKKYAGKKGKTGTVKKMKTNC